MSEATASSYCCQKAAPPGSNLYYSILYYPGALKRDLYAWHAFASEIEEIQWECSDPGIARMKLAWWQEEVHRLEVAVPRHPVTQELGQLLPRFPIVPSLLREMIGHYEMRFDKETFESPGQLKQYMAKGPGCLWSFSGQICGYKNTRTETILTDAGCLFEQFNLLQQQSLNAGFYWPVGGLNEVVTQLQALLQAFPKEDYRSQLHVIIMAKLILATCAEIARNPNYLETYRIGLTPIRKLLLSRWIKFRYG